ncbi:hypothetical protein AB0D12_29880 [Streptomyces sp. NPDC048479]
MDLLFFDTTSTYFETEEAGEPAPPRATRTAACCPREVILN